MTTSYSRGAVLAATLGLTLNFTTCSVKPEPRPRAGSLLDDPDPPGLEGADAPSRLPPSDRGATHVD